MIKIGQYCQVHEHEDPRNSQVPRNKGNICLGPGGNEQRGFRFMSLNSAKNITRKSWNIILIPDTVISLVKKLACNDQIILYSQTSAVILLETSRSQECIGMLLIATKSSPHKNLLTSSTQNKRQSRSQSNQITKLTSTSTTRHPQNKYRHPSNHLNIQSNHQ